MDVPAAAGELRGSTFACLAGCGFCCTFPPEVSRLELGRLRRKTPVRVTSDGERSYLALQNQCGACTLLERRACQAYDERPAHCRYFPFHVHFAREPEAYLNFTCRGVERAEGGDLVEPFRQSVLAVARPDDWATHVREARDTYAEFERRARRAGAWGAVAPVLQDALQDAPRLLAKDGILSAASRAGEPTDEEEAHEAAFAPFAAEDVTKRPFYLAPDLRWLTFLRRGDELAVLEMDEQGRLEVRAKLAGFASWSDPPAAARAAVAPYLARLTTRGSFEGSVFALVDASDYRMGVEAATWARLAELGADLAARIRVLEALGTPPERIGAETERFYDSTFLDAPTIGGWL